MNMGLERSLSLCGRGRRIDNDQAGSIGVRPRGDEYLHAIDERKRGTLETLRQTILEIVPEADQVISYRIPRSACAVRLSPALPLSRTT
jgi:hypothetical protein